MAINLDKLRSKLDELKSSNTRGAYKASLIWKPTAKPQDIRLVPYTHQKDTPFIELYFYYFMKPRTYLAPCTFGHPDPIFEYVNKLRASSDPQDQLYAKKMQPTKRVYVPVLVRGSEHEGVKFWGIGPTIHAEIMEKILNPEYGDITDLTNGSDITVIQIPKEQTIDGKFPKQKFDVRRRPSPAFDNNDQQLRDLVANQPNIITVFKEPTYEELTSALNNWLNAGETEEESSTVPNANIPNANVPYNSTYNAPQVYQAAPVAPVAPVQMPQQAYAPQPATPQAYVPQPATPQAYVPQPATPQAYVPQPQAQSINRPASGQPDDFENQFKVLFSK